MSKIEETFLLAINECANERLEKTADVSWKQAVLVYTSTLYTYTGQLLKLMFKHIIILQKKKYR